MTRLLRLLLAVGSLASLLPATAGAADIRVLAISPMRGPLTGLVEHFGRGTGHRVEIVYGVPAELVKRLAKGEAADAVLMTQGPFEEAVKTGRVIAGSRTEIGRAGVGVMTRTGTRAPDISTPDALKKALLDADTLAFNQRPSGVHFATVLERLGIADQVKAKTRRPDADAGVFEHVRKGKGRDLGIVNLPAIMADAGKTVRLVGPLPAQLQSYEPYYAGLTAKARSPEAAKVFLGFLTSPETRATLASRGLEQVR